MSFTILTKNGQSKQRARGKSKRVLLSKGICTINKVVSGWSLTKTDKTIKLTKTLKSSSYRNIQKGKKNKHIDGQDAYLCGAVFVETATSRGVQNDIFLFQILLQTFRIPLKNVVRNSTGYNASTFFFRKEKNNIFFTYFSKNCLPNKFHSN